MSNSVRRHIITINSKDNLTNNGSDAQYNFAQSDLHEVHRVQLKDVAITNLIYNVETGKNDVLNYNVGGVDKSITLPAGSYQAGTLQNSLNTLLAADNIVFSFSGATFKYSVTSTANSYLKSTSTIKKIIGFVSDTPTAPGTTSYTMPDPCDFIRTHYIHILSDLASLDHAYTSGGMRLPVIASIPVTLPFGYILSRSEELDSADVDFKKAHVNISDLSIKMVDDDFNELNLNGGDYFLSFSVSKR